MLLLLEEVINLGMFDSLYIKCPKCGHELEYQSKSGPCSLLCFNEKDLPVVVAIGLDNQVVECEFCRNNWELKCLNIPELAKIKLSKAKRKADYSGNHNPKLLKNIKRMAEIMGQGYK